MLKRKAYERLTQWKTSWGASKALLVTGARQIGKSYLIRHFGRENFSSYFEVNLLTNKAALQALSVDKVHRALWGKKRGGLYQQGGPAIGGEACRG